MRTPKLSASPRPTWDGILTCRACSRQYDHCAVEAEGWLPDSPPAVCSPACLSLLVLTSSGWQLKASVEALAVTAQRAVRRLADLPRFLKNNGSPTLSGIVAECLADLRASLEAEEERITVGGDGARGQREAKAMTLSEFRDRCTALADEARAQARAAASGEDQKVWRQMAHDLAKVLARTEQLDA